MNNSGAHFPKGGRIIPNQLLLAWKKLNSSQKGTLISVFVLALMLPMAIFASFFQNSISSYAALKPRTYMVTPVINQGIKIPDVTPPDPQNNITKPATPTAKPTTAISPTLIPTITNRPPAIASTLLPKGQVNKPYNAIISGTDQDTADTLQMDLTNLPPGITQDQCLTTKSGNVKYMRCLIKGIPTLAGIYPVNVRLADNHGGVANKILSLTIINPK